MAAGIRWTLLSGRKYKDVAVVLDCGVTKYKYREIALLAERSSEGMQLDLHR